MPKDVIITPANGKLDFYGTAGGSVLANINLTDNNDLSLSTTNGNLIIGDASRDVYIGDGTNEVDIVFEQNGQIRSVAGKYITVNAGTVNATGVAVNTSSPTAVMHVYGSTPSGTVLNVEGTNGSLFSVVDDLDGTLMSVNNNAGLPVLEVFSDDKIVGGRFGQNDFIVSSSGNVGIGKIPDNNYKLDVNGKLNLYNSTSLSNAQIYVENTDGYLFIDSNTEVNINSTFLYINSNAQTNGSFTATSFVKTDGTSSQFLKADGSTDSTAYTTNTGTVTSIATNNGLTGGTITTTGTIGLTGQALALHNLSTNGIIARTGSGTVAARTISAGTGISITNGDGVSGNPTITNSDLGSSQNIFKNIAVAGQSSVVADSNNDTLTFVAGSNITITTDANNDSITINSTASGGGGGTVTSVSGTGTVSGLTLSGTVTTSGSLTLGGTLSVSESAIANNAVSNAKAADMAVNTIKGRITTGTGDPEDLTAANVRSIINVENGAQVNTVTSVAGKTGAVTLTNSDVGLGNVSNVAALPLAGGTLTGNLVSTSAGSSAAAQLYLNGASQNRIEFNTNGIGGPSIYGISVGTKIRLYPSLVTTSATDFAIGLANDGGGGAPTRFWQSVNTNSSRFEWFAGGSEIAELTGGGQLLLLSNAGYTTPTLTLFNDGATDGSFRFFPMADGAGGYITFNSSANTTSNGILVGGSSTMTGYHASRRQGAFQWVAGTADSTSRFEFLTANGGTTAQTMTSRMAITAQGRVGIGTNTPTVALDVVGEISADNVKIGGNSLSITNSNGSLNILPNGTGSVSIGNNGSIILSPSFYQFEMFDSSPGPILKVNDSEIFFKTSGGATPDGEIYALYISRTSTDTMVGIGTNYPSEFLHVTGNILCEKLFLEKTSSPTISSSTLTINLSDSQLFLVSLNSNITTLTINNVPVTSNVTVGFTIIFTADGTARSVTWPASVKWAGGTAPTLTSTNAKRDVLSFISTDNGTTWLGFVGGQNY